jgi:prephenate dehydrogenase
MTMPLFRKIAIFGVGLIGGSFALALKKGRRCRANHRCRP